jgi:hypothetical protein
MVAEAEQQNAAYRSGGRVGSHAYVYDLHEAQQSEELKEKLKPIKEAQHLGMFRDAYNRKELPAIVGARKNPRGVGHADYTVFSESGDWEHDLELTSIFERWDDFPKWTDTEDPSVQHVELSEPRRPLEDLQSEVRKDVVRVLKSHARRTHYPKYWLSIYANLSLEAYQLPPDCVAQVVREKLKTWSPSGNLDGVFVIAPTRVDRIL